ncbi:MAG: hypothetical protein QOJ99_5677 [Bryobacterales bacterium]|jgi:hypothetical protein|nr:hypothetical protein [Bryobacterales bacterium]
MLLTACGGGNTSSRVRENGAPASAETKALEAGARALQSAAPVKGLDIYLDAFHPMADDVQIQMEAHHYCRQMNEDFAQCVLFDGNTSDAKMNGIEYIISERVFQTLPAAERKYWHPHNYEILSGELVAPGLPEAAEKALLRKKMNSYGKTWHVWMTDSHGKAGDSLPLGEPHLAWSFNRDGELDAAMLRDRDMRMGIDSQKKRQDRQDMVKLAKPQSGVDRLKDKFPGTLVSIPGVTDAGK